MAAAHPEYHTAKEHVVGYRAVIPRVVRVEGVIALQPDMPRRHLPPDRLHTKSWLRGTQGMSTRPFSA